MDHLEHKKHKYITKLKSNGRTRYFYTNEELAAFRKALSSKDERDRFTNVTGVTSRHRKFYNDKYMNSRAERKEAVKDSRLEVEELRRERAQKPKNDRREINVKYNKMKKAQDDYDRAKTLKGKIEDVRKVNEQVMDRRAKDKVVKNGEGIKNKPTATKVEVNINTGNKNVGKQVKDLGKKANKAKYPTVEQLKNDSTGVQKKRNEAAAQIDYGVSEARKAQATYYAEKAVTELNESDIESAAKYAKKAFNSQMKSTSAMVRVLKAAGRQYIADYLNERR